LSLFIQCVLKDNEIFNLLDTLTSGAYAYVTNKANWNDLKNHEFNFALDFALWLMIRLYDHATIDSTYRKE